MTQAATQRLPSPNTKYPFVGPNYMKYGETKGYVYDPYTDSYYIDPKSRQKQYESEGLIEKPEEPSLTDIVLPGAAVAGAAALAKAGGEAIPDAIGGLIGGSSAPATTAATGAAGTVGATGGVGTGLAGGGGAGGIAGVGPIADGAAYGASITPSGFELGGFGSAGNYLAPGLGLIGAGDLLINKKHGAGGAAQGAASGAAIGSYFGLPGAAVGAGLGGLIGYFGNFGDKDRWKEEGDRLRKLQDNGVYVPQGLIDSMPTKGRSKEELINIAEQTGGNVQFAKSRNEKDLRGQDIIGYSTFAEKDPNWFKRPVQEQIDYANQLLNAGLVRESKGQISIDWSKAPPLPGQQPAQTTRPATVGGLIG